MSPPLIVTATTEEELDRLPVHDQWACTDDLTFCDGKITIPMEIEKWFVDEGFEPDGLPTGWRRFLPYSYRVPLLKSELTISDVLDYDMEDRSQIGGTHVNEIRLCDGLLVVECIEEVTLQVRVSRLRVDLQVMDEVVGHLLYTETPFCGQFVRRVRDDVADA